MDIYDSYLNIHICLYVKYVDHLLSYLYQP